MWARHFFARIGLTTGVVILGLLGRWGGRRGWPGFRSDRSMESEAPQQGFRRRLYFCAAREFGATACSTGFLAANFQENCSERR
jgi:hypothetical protein